jgi:hypothetical protein
MGRSPRLFVQEGQRFGRGVVTGPDIRVRQGSRERRGARLTCDCGRVYESVLSNLISGASKSCGCLSTKWKHRDAMRAGDRFGRGTVIDPDAGHHSSGHRLVTLACDCGNAYTITYSQCLGGATQSCGCLHRENTTTHGMHGHPLFGTWQAMLHRCENPGHRHYHSYGGRGIKVCHRWHDVRLFVADIESSIGPRPAGHTEGGKPLYTLDRIDTNGDYEPGKVRWATWAEQIANRRPFGEWVTAGRPRNAT